jgi:hypothetical protein
MLMKRVLVGALLLISGLVIIGMAAHPAPIAAQANTSTSSSTSIPPVYFRVGPGYTDVIPRQIVRTADDRVYIFAGNAQGSNKINVFWTTNPGLPNSAADFSGSTSLTDSANTISVESVYDGTRMIHVFANNQSGVLNDFPFDTTNNTFKAAKTISTGDPTVSGGYIGSSGVSGMFDKSGILHLAYWTGGNHIVYAEYTYNVNTDTLVLTSGPTQLDDGSGVFRHPSLVISPYDNSLVVGWTERGTPNPPNYYEPGNILVRKRDKNGVWGAITQVNTAAAWTSDESGADIDQGPQMVVTSDGIYHLVYIEYGATDNTYGHVHYVVQNVNGAWTDIAIAFYTHDPALATTTANALYIIGHGHVQNANCTDHNNQICTVRQNSDGTWAIPQVFATQSGSDNFDSSPSVNWSVVGRNRPDAIEFLFFSPNGGSYFNTSVWYARIGVSMITTATPTSAATATSTSSPSNTPSGTSTFTDVPTFTPSSTATSTNTASNTPSRTSTSTGVPTFTPSSTATSTSSPSNTPSGTSTSTGVPTFTPSSTATSTNTATATATTTMTKMPAPGLLNTIGVFRKGTFYLRFHNTAGYSNLTIAFNPAVRPFPIDGDWKGIGVDAVGVYDQSNAVFSLRSTNKSTFTTISLSFGNPNDTPLAGRWLAGATTAGVGTFRPSNGIIYLKNALKTGQPDFNEVLGIPGDTGLAGDWTGQGYDSPGVYRGQTSTFYLSNQVTNGTVHADIVTAYGMVGDQPVIGDWIGQGHDGLGLFRASTRMMYLQNSVTGNVADNVFAYGIPGDVPIAGHWVHVYPAIAPPPVLIAKTASPLGTPSSGSVPGDNLIGD